MVESVISCGAVVQVSFPHKCGQLSRCSALNVEVMATFPDISFLLCLHIFVVFLSVLLSSARSQLRHSQDAFAPRTIGPPASLPQTSVHRFSPN